MTNTIKLTQTDIIQDDKLMAIEYHYPNGDFAFQAVWSPQDEHTPEKIAEFRAWCKTMATRLNYVVD